jgi:hypothetical protein
MDVNDFQEWLASAAVGAQCLYHTGELARDAQGTDTVPSVPGLKQLAKAAMKAELWGDVALFQRRLKRNRFQYIAMRTQSQQYRSILTAPATAVHFSPVSPIPQSSPAAAAGGFLPATKTEVNHG